MLESSSGTLYIILGIAVIPLLEELMFRLGLSKKRKHLLVSSSLVIGHFIAIILLYFFGDQLTNHVLAYFTVLSIIAVKAFFFFKAKILRNKSFIELLERFVKRDFPSAYFLSAVLFSMAHQAFQIIYQNYSNASLFSLFLIYTCYGILYNRMRLDKGFRFALAFHISINTLGFLRTLISGGGEGATCEQCLFPLHNCIEKKILY